MLHSAAQMESICEGLGSSRVATPVGEWNAALCPGLMFCAAMLSFFSFFFLLSSADAVAKRYRPWPKGLRADSLPWFDSPLVQGASRLRYTDKAQVAATGPYWPKGARNKKMRCHAFSVLELPFP